MSDEFDFSTGLPSEEMADYLQMYLDETSEQLDALVETLLVLEGAPGDAAQLNEAFRLIHSIKGSSAMMGLDSITVLTHHLENHFERLRSGLVPLERPVMDLILRCIDFLRACNRRLREGTPLGSAPELLEELNALTASTASRPLASHRSGSDSAEASVAVPPAEPEASRVAAPHSVIAAVPGEAASKSVSEPPVAEPDDRSATGSSTSPDMHRLVVHFEAGLPLIDMKAELVLARLAALAAIQQTFPERNALESLARRHILQVLLHPEGSLAELRAAADVDGVKRIEIEAACEFLADLPALPSDAVERIVIPTSAPARPETTSSGDAQPARLAASTAPPTDAAATALTPTEATESKSIVAETVRVDIDRLDNLMNLAGELIVNKARFVQILRQMTPAFRKSSLAGRARTFGESMRQALMTLRAHSTNGDGELDPVGEHLHALEAELDAIEEQSRLWEESRRCFGQIGEAVDQLTRVSDSLQRGVLDTRMVPVAPLFNRFKRVVRDISHELGKNVHLEIRGEKTELDKRMIDALGDPLVHLVRNAIDHGIEPGDVRLGRGKPEAGTIRLEATHSGNNVYITVCDDGGGVNVARARRRIVQRGLLTESAAAELSDRDVIDHIWHPGFSTAEVVSDISGRGVGMDIVKTRIAELNGTIDVASDEGRGATFTIRLPLTLAIIRSLLFRLTHGVFAVPIDNVREIVSVPAQQIVSIRGRQTFELRGEFLPLVDITDIFDWGPARAVAAAPPLEETARTRVDVVILHGANRAMGLRVNALHGVQDVVIKSLAENFIPIRGLSGASILGDGSVCLLLDAVAAIDLATTRPAAKRSTVAVER